jgi:phage-related protein
MATEETTATETENNTGETAETEVKEVKEDAPKAAARPAAKKAAPKAKVAAEKEAPKEAVKKNIVIEKVDGATTFIKESVESIESAISDAAHSGTDKVKGTVDSIESKIDEARKSGNERAKKIVADMKLDKIVNEKVAGYIGETTAVCYTIFCSPMAYASSKIEKLYKKSTK